jgi:hypothetical protein
MRRKRSSAILLLEVVRNLDVSIWKGKYGTMSQDGWMQVAAGGGRSRFPAILANFSKEQSPQIPATNILWIQLETSWT